LHLPLSFVFFEKYDMTLKRNAWKKPLGTTLDWSAYGAKDVFLNMLELLVY
jgi:hypothetical protein